MTDYPKPWSWPGAIALVLASCLGLGWLVGVGAAALGAIGSSAPDPAAVQLLSGIGQVLAGSLGTYLGFTVAVHRLGRSEPPEPPRWHNE
jgi:hypothetical protein